LAARLELLVLVNLFSQFLFQNLTQLYHKKNKKYYNKGF